MSYNKLIDKIKELDYPYNLEYAIFDYDMEEVNKVCNKCVYDFKGSVEYALYTLTTCERKVIKYRFEELKTFKEIGNILGLSLERIRQIQNKALKKLRHPSRIKYFKYGIDGIIDNIKNEYIHELDNINTELITIKEEKSLKKIPIIYIEDMNLSGRSYNGLKRAGINTLFECSMLTYDELIKIRSLGKHSIEEIITKLRSHGYEIKKSEE